MFARILYLTAALLLGAVAARAQTVTSIGPVTPGHVPAYNSPTVIKDSGIPAAGLVSCTALGAFGVGTGSAAQCSTANNSTAVLNGGPLTINPTTQTLTQGLLINQTGPVSGSVSSGPINLNLITVAFSSGNATPQTRDFGWWSNLVTSFRVNFTIGGASTQGEYFAIAGHLRVTTATPAAAGDMGAVGGVAYTNVVNTPGGELFGGAFAAIVDTGGSINQLTALEGDCTILGGSANRRTCLLLGDDGSVGRGSVQDALITLHSGSSSGNFLTGILLDGTPIATTGDFLAAFNSMTITNFINLSTVTVTGNILAFPNATLTGAGALSLGGNITETFNQNATSSFQINNNSAGTLSATAYVLTNGTNVAAFVLTGTAWSGSPAIEGPNRLVLRGVGVSAIVIEVNNASPIIFGISDTEVARVAPSGGFVVGSTTDPGAGVVFANVALLSAILVGGQTASSTLTIESTNAVGTSDSILFKTGSQVVAGFINTSQQWTIGPNVAPISGPTLIVNQNTLQVPSGSLSNIVAQFGTAVNTLGRIQLIGAGNSNFTGQFAIDFMQSRGTFSSPTATQSGDLIGAFGAIGYGTSFQTGGGVAISFLAAEVFDGTHGGMKFQVKATPNAAVVPLTYLELGGANAWQAFNMGTGAGNGAICGDTNVSNATGGTVRYNNNAACTASLRQFKRNIEPLNAGLAEVMQLKPRQFYFLPGHGNNGAMQQMGLVADEVEKIDRRLATYDVSGHLDGVNYVYAVTLAFRAIQELKADNDNLRAQLAQLRRMAR